MQVTFEQTGNIRRITIWKSGHSKKLMPKATLEVDMSDDTQAQKEVRDFIALHAGETVPADDL